MKKLFKALLISAMTIGMGVACETTKPTPVDETNVNDNEQNSNTDNNGTEETNTNNGTNNGENGQGNGEGTNQGNGEGTNEGNGEGTNEGNGEGTNEGNGEGSNTNNGEGTNTGTQEAQITDITVNADAVKANYKVGENLDLTGLVVKANYDDNSVVDVTEFITDPANGAVLNEAGEVTVTVSYQNFTKTFKVNVVSVSGYALDTTAVKATYVQGENLDLSGLKVYKNYSDNTKEEVTEFTVSVENGTALNEVGKVTITVTVDGNELSFDVEVSKAPKTAWTDEETALMRTHLYGIALPYTGFEESIITYSAKYDTLYIEGGAATNSDLRAYGNLLTKMGFKKISNQSYLYQGRVNTTNGYRYIRIYFGLNENNEFSLEAYDPYYYLFPSDYGEYVAYMAFSSDVVVPAFEADYYQIDEDSSAIYCYVNSETAEADYTEILTNAGWDLSTGIDEETGYLSAVSPDGRYMIYYSYLEQYGDLDICFAPLKTWNSSLVEQFYTKYGTNHVAVPTLDIDGGKYQFVEPEANDEYFQNGHIEMIYAKLYIYNATTDDLTNYVSALRTALWTVSGLDNFYNAKYQIGTSGFQRIEIQFKADDNMIEITFYAKLDDIPNSDFPSATVATLLGSDITDKLPVYEGENEGFSVLNDLYGTAVVVEVPDGVDEEECANAYDAILVEYGYSYDENSGYYLSPLGQIVVKVYVGTSGSFTIEFGVAPQSSWPTNRVQRFISEYFDGADDVLPAYNGGVQYTVTEGNTAGTVQIQIVMPSGTNVDDEVAAYENSLEGFTYVGKDNYDCNIFLSPDKEYYLCAWNYYNAYLIIDLWAAEKEDESLWPTEALTAYLESKWYSDTLPEYTGNYTKAEVGEDFYTGNLLVEFTCDNGQDTADAYVELLKDEGFKLYGTNSWGDRTLISPNKEYAIVVIVTDVGFEIVFDYVPSDYNDNPVNNNDSGFPINGLSSMFADANGIVPVLEDENATFSGEDLGSEYLISITFADEDAAETYYNNYVAALGTAGFTTDTWFGSTVYVYEGASFFIYMDFTGNTVTMTVYPIQYLSF